MLLNVNSRSVLAVFACALILTLASARRPRAATADVLPFKSTERTLPNGLRVIIVPTGFPNLVSIQVPVQTGSRNEVEPGKSGFAHFFEHMMGRGTKSYSKEKLNTLLKVTADRFRNLSYTEEDFKTESRAVLGEYNKNSANPIRKLNEVM